MTPLERSARMAVQAMEEYVDAQEAQFPSAEKGQAAQTAWAVRRGSALDGVRAALSSLREALQQPKDGGTLFVRTDERKYMLAASPSMKESEGSAAPVYFADDSKLVGAPSAEARQGGNSDA